MARLFGLDLSDLGQGPVASFYRNNNESSCSMECSKFHGCLCSYLRLKKKTAWWN